MNSTLTQWVVCLAVASAGPCTDPGQAPRGDLGGEPAAAPPRAASPEPKASAPQQTAATQQTQTTKSYMRAHTAEALAMRRAAITGKLGELSAAARSIASDSWSPHLKPEYQVHVDAVRAAARGAVDATALDSAILALGRLGAECASCHKAVGGPPEPPGAAVPLAADEPMKAHAQAEEALWVGLTFPSDASWKRGAQGLLDAPPIDSDVQAVSAVAHRTEPLAREALAAGSARADLYAKILATCSTCHTRVDIAR